MIDYGICPWCQVSQRFTSYGRQQCQSCSKPITVIPDIGEESEASRLWVLQRKQEQLQEVADFLSEGLKLGLEKYAEELRRDIDNLLRKGS